MRGTFDENHVDKTSQDPLSIHGGLMTRARTKKIKEALNGLIEYISSSCIHQDTFLTQISIQDSLCLSILFKLLNLIVIDLNEAQTRLYQFGKKNQQNLCFLKDFLISFGNKIFYFYFRINMVSYSLLL